MIYAAPSSLLIDVIDFIQQIKSVIKKKIAFNLNTYGGIDSNKINNL